MFLCSLTLGLRAGVWEELQSQEVAEDSECLLRGKEETSEARMLPGQRLEGQSYPQ